MIDYAGTSAVFRRSRIVLFSFGKGASRVHKLAPNGGGFEIHPDRRQRRSPIYGVLVNGSHNRRPLWKWHMSKKSKNIDLSEEDDYGAILPKVSRLHLLL